MVIFQRLEMSENRKIYKPGPVRGFPEWLPEERLIEQRWFDNIRRVFESYGFCNIETPSVEELDVLAAKGEVDKEIYVIERLHKDDNDKKEARLALHFDQTVPMARYVAMNFNNLVFPFKRYQMQRVWRGERPQMGRMREFYQCDIDVINVDNLPISFDAEVASMMYEVLESLNIGRVQLRISNRKIIAGFLEEWGVPDPTELLRIIDKIEKVGESQTFSDIAKASSRSGFGEDLNVANMLMGLSKIKASTSQELRDKLDNLERRPGGPKHLQGIEELCFVLDNLSHLPEGAVIADLSIVRGLDYYTGTVYETQLLDVPEFTGSVCSGGRYDDLAGSYINKHLPGVGISLGFSRLFDVIKQKRPDLMGLSDKSPKGPAHVMMMMPENEADRPLAHDTARQLRKNGINVEMYHAPKKFGDQLKYASKKNIPYVWIIRDGTHAVKDMNAETQTQADPQTWSPDRKALDEVA
jgi:histidyl-tRNA synthetase